MMLNKFTTHRRSFGHNQDGASFITVLLYLAMGGITVLGFLKILPHYIELFSIKKVFASLAQSEEIKTGTVADIRTSYDRRAMIDNITAIKGVDLDITKENNDTVITAAWQQRIPLFTGYTLLIDFAVSTTDK
jgi:hypothetical protein